MSGSEVPGDGVVSNSALGKELADAVVLYNLKRTIRLGGEPSSSTHH